MYTRRTYIDMLRVFKAKYEHERRSLAIKRGLRAKKNRSKCIDYARTSDKNRLRNNEDYNGGKKWI